MVRIAADLHIHSCLSPCADMEMTPNNIVNMAYIKGLCAIAVCDHNTAKNLPPIKALCDECGIILLPGLEIETREEVHILTYFSSVKAALDFGEWIYSFLPNIKNNKRFFGEQVAMDVNDEPIYEEERLLSQSADISIDDVVEQCRLRGGVPVPAHINRTANSLLRNLGFIPEGLHFTSLELYKHVAMPKIQLEDYHIIFNSDAHSLENISEPENFTGAFEKNAAGILAYLNSPK